MRSATRAPVPLGRYFNSEVLLYFISDFANVPRFVEFIIFALYVYLLIQVDTKRRKAAKGKPKGGLGEGVDPEVSGLLERGGGAVGPAGPGDTEKRLALFFYPAYIVAGVCMWFSYDFDTFLRLSTFLFLVPQLLANLMWDLPGHSVKAVSWIYVIGNTVAQVHGALGLPLSPVHLRRDLLHHSLLLHHSVLLHPFVLLHPYLLLRHSLLLAPCLLLVACTSFCQAPGFRCTCTATRCRVVETEVAVCSTVCLGGCIGACSWCG